MGCGPLENRFRLFSRSSARRRWSRCRWESVRRTLRRSVNAMSRALSTTLKSLGFAGANAQQTQGRGGGFCVMLAALMPPWIEGSDLAILRKETDVRRRMTIRDGEEPETAWMSIDRRAVRRRPHRRCRMHTRGCVVAFLGQSVRRCGATGPIRRKRRCRASASEAYGAGRGCRRGTKRQPACPRMLVVGAMAFGSLQ